VERDPDICGFRSDELIPRIPSIPLSYQNAQKLFELMGNNAQPPHDWIGSLSGYSVGPSSRQVELEVANRFENATQWNVVAKITGILKPEQEVILGNHRDAWVFGAVDPNSGTCTSAS
jgi:N-acetylated-alpha-linked acidic dipeptidase